MKNITLYKKLFISLSAFQIQISDPKLDTIYFRKSQLKFWGLSIRAMKTPQNFNCNFAKVNFIQFVSNFGAEDGFRTPMPGGGRH